MRPTLFVGLFLSAALCLACTCPGPKPPRGAGGSGKDARPAATDAEQEERRAWIAKATERGVFREVKYEKDVTVYVGPAWRLLDFKDKEKAVAVVAYYHFRIPKSDKIDSGEHVFLHDPKTGKLIGTYSELGLQLD